MIIPNPGRTREILEQATSEYGYDPSDPWVRCHREQQEYRGRAQWIAIFKKYATEEEFEGHGLRFPPFVPPDDMPAFALIAAARYLRVATMGTPAAKRQGWDSEDHHGLGAGRLQLCWDEARRRIGVRFFSLLRWCLKHPGKHPPRIRGLSSPGALRVLRTPEWVECPDGGRMLIGINARRALGEFPPEAQAIGLRHACEVAKAEGNSSIRTRHIDWRAAQEVAIRVAKTPADRRWALAAAYAASAGQSELAARFGPIQIPEYPMIPAALAARLLLGEKPTALAPGLTAREAHEWLLDGGTADPRQWILRNTAYGYQGLVVRDMKVAKWLLAVSADEARTEALRRVREIQGPHGERISVRYVDRVDEIIGDDLPAGPATGVQKAFENAVQRVGTAQVEMWSKDNQVLVAPPLWWKPVKCARMLLTPAELAREGTEMNHCVGTYVEYVRHGQSFVVAINVRGQRSTAELDTHGNVVQHRGVSNSEPSPLCKKCLATALRRSGVAR